MIPANFIDPQLVPILIPFVILSVNLTYSIISKLFDMFWKQHIKNLNEILDLDKKLDHRDKKVRELVELHQARFFIQKEGIQEYKQQKYSLGFKWLGNKSYLINKIIRSLYYFLLGYALYSIIVDRSSNLFLFSIIVGWVLILGLQLILAIITLLKGKLFFHRTKALSTYSVTLKSNALGHPVKQFKVKIPTNRDGYEVFDFIGKPLSEEIEIYKLGTNQKIDPRQPVSYTYQYTRLMTPLEVEWASKLNQISIFYRRSTPYIPYLRQCPEKGITYSAYYLLAK